MKLDDISIKKVKSLLKRCVFYGKKYYCPCCNNYFGRYRKFNSKDHQFYNKNIYKGKKQFVICPYCWSLPRHRIICEYLDNNINLIKNRKIILFAPEQGMEKWLKRNNIPYKSADLYRKNVELQLDITDIELKSNSVDGIICNHILEHVYDYNNAIDEVYRVLKENGIFIVSVPIDINKKMTFEVQTKNNEERRTIYGQADHYRNFGTNFIEILKKYKFKVEEINGDNMSKKIMPIIGPGEYDYNHIYVCIK